MTLPSSKPFGQCTFAFGREKPDARTLRGIEFKDGCNNLRFVYTPPSPEKSSSAKQPAVVTSYFIHTKVYLWKASDKVVVTDIDGTLTTTDLMGHIKTVRLANYQYAHSGACGFFSSLSEYGFKVYFLTARPITWMNETRAFLANVRQDGMALPEGPICCSTHHTAEKLVRAMFGIEYADRIKTRFLNELHDVFARAGRDYTRYGRPLIAGFGNSRTDTRAYQNAHIPFRFNINKKSVLTMEVESARSRGQRVKNGRHIASKKQSPSKNKTSKSQRYVHRRSVQRLKFGVWNVLKDTDSFLGQNAYEMPASDLEKCRATCERMGFGGFAVWNNRAYFRRQSPARCIEARRRVVKAQFHLAPLFESETHDITARYDSEALIMTEESQSDAQEQFSELDDTISESDVEVTCESQTNKSEDDLEQGCDAKFSRLSSNCSTTAPATQILAMETQSTDLSQILDEQDGNDPLSTILIDPNGEHNKLVDVTEATASLDETQNTIDQSTRANEKDNNLSVEMLESQTDNLSDSDSDEFEDADDTSIVRSTNRPKAISIPTRMFNSVKSLIPQFFNLLASPILEDVDTALAGLEQLKITEEVGIAKLQQLQQQEKQLRKNTVARKANKNTPGDQATKGEIPIGTNNTGIVKMIDSVPSGTTKQSDKVSARPVTKPATSTSLVDFFSIFTRTSNAKSVNIDQTCFAGFDDPKLHLILDVMSVQRAR